MAQALRTGLGAIPMFGQAALVIKGVVNGGAYLYAGSNIFAIRNELTQLLTATFVPSSVVLLLSLPCGASDIS
jgi:hypothetical protein